MARPRLTNPVMRGLERMAREVRAKDGELLAQIDGIRDRRSRSEATRELEGMRRAAAWIEAMSAARSHGCLYDDMLEEQYAAQAAASAR